ncbi:MAG: biotin--[acetyl-CoA-carboxylase] ligase [Betaproteobacteria bacterium]|nr:biotin--[acetyl-CoA-carboxylase] ligase [Betaproteobacteria bacterium]
MPSVSIGLLRRLSDVTGDSAQALALACGVTQAGLRRALARLAQAGLVECDGGRARLLRAFDFLDARRIAHELGADIDVAVLDACGSTNSELLQAPPHPRMRLLLAEEQTAGRGRRARRWLSPIGDGLALSLRRDFPHAPRDLAALSLAAGVAAARALRALGARETRLKWPNDLLLGGAKLGGILVETRMQGTAVAAVVGIGINMRSAAGLGARLRRRVAALEDCLAPPPSRNTVAARIARELCGVLDAYEQRGLAAIRDEWEALDAYRGKRLRVRMADGSVLAGVAEGIAEDGGLRLRTAQGLRAVRSGHVILPRAA